MVSKHVSVRMVEGTFVIVNWQEFWQMGNTIRPCTLELWRGPYKALPLGKCLELPLL